MVINIYSNYKRQIKNKITNIKKEHLQTSGCFFYLQEKEGMQSSNKGEKQ